MSLRISRDLVERAQSGDTGALEQIVDQSVPLVLGWCSRLGGRGVDGEDATHDVFVIVVTRIEGLRDPDRFAAWLYGVTRGVVRRHRTRAWLRRWLGPIEREPVSPRLHPDDDLAAREVRAHVWEILDALPLEQRDVVVLADLEERSLPEIAELLGVPLGTVKSRLRLGRERFRALARKRKLDPFERRSAREAL